MTAADVTDAVVSAHAQDTAPIDEHLLARVLEPYSYKGCRYLNEATYAATENSMLALGTFSIADSAYIRSTGHFNAVELVLCFNQLAYSAFAPAVVAETIPAFRGWTIDEYCTFQLSSMLIKSASTRFKRAINAGNFSARLQAHDFQIIERSARYLLVPCAIDFWDDNGGAASGEFQLAVLNIP